jgi:hypothetical protein
MIMDKLFQIKSKEIINKKTYSHKNLEIRIKS